MKSLDTQLEQKIKSKLQTIGNNANPRLVVLASRAKTTVSDGEHWTTETILQGSGLGEISVAPRRFRVNGKPNRIYGIHVQNLVVNTLIREYPDKLQQGWQKQFSLGGGRSVALAFNGEWKRYRKLWRFVSNVEPQVSWVDMQNILWTQTWDDVTTKEQLATNVKMVKMLRGWKNPTIQQNDQGLIVAYIKMDGSVWYRNYCIQSDYTEVWEPERRITAFEGVAESLNMFLTNDYRMGFIIQRDNGQVSWFITPRNWGGMASPAEQIAINMDISFDVTPIKYSTVNIVPERISCDICEIGFNVAEPIHPKLVEYSNPDQLTIMLKFSHILQNDLSNVKTAFKIKDSKGVDYPILSTLAGKDNSELILKTPNFGGAVGDLFISYNRNIIPLDVLHQGSLFGVNSFTVNFTPVIIPIPGFTSEELSMSVIDPTFNVIIVSTKDVYENEYIKTKLSDMAITVTKVGDAPL